MIRRRAWLLSWLLLLPGAAEALPQPPGRPPAATAAVEVEEALGTRIPQDLRFLDQDGRLVNLREVLGQGRPVILTLAYFRCPMLCELVVKGLAQTLNRVDWAPGQQYQALTVSIDPKDRPANARLKQTAILQAVGQPAARAGWPFLVDPGEENVRRLADVIGFRYAYDPRSDQYAHPAVAVVLSPDGRIARYLYGVAFRPLDVRLALTEASRGKIGGLTERVLLTCFRYDPATRKYGLYINALLKGGSALVLLSVGTALGLMVRRDRRRQRGEPPGSIP